MKILRAGDRGQALAPERGRVEVVYEYRAVELGQTGVMVRDVLVGVDAETGEIVTIPAQSTPKLKAARDSRKDVVMSVRIPRELGDVLRLVADFFHAETDQFTPALIRYYLSAAASNEGLARRLSRLSKSRLAKGELRESLRVRVRRDLQEAVNELALRTHGVNKSDVVRGAIIAAKEDVLDGRAGKRQRELEAVALAV